MILKSIQSALLIKIDQVSNICIKNNIPFYLIGGSLLGAIRHKGFIPWDDDIDIGILRPNFEKFSNILESNIYDIDFESYKSNENYIYSFIKIVDKSIEVDFDWHNNLNFKTYASIDVFPIDGTPNLLIFRYLYVLYVQSLISFKNYLFLNPYKRSFGKKMFSIFLKKIIKVKPNVLIKFIEIQMKRYPVEKSKYLINYSGLYGFRELSKKDTFGSPIPLPFDSLVLFGVQKYHTYLSRIYGNYSIIPDEKKRFSHYTISDNVKS
jgi:lipopolysaccharide cholinephosphotransferase